MAITKTTDMTNSVVTRYMDKYYLVAAEDPGVWAQFIDWQPAIPEDGGGASSFDFPIYGEADPVEAALTNEDDDITPDTLYDDNVTVTPYEYGKVWALTKKLRYQSRTNLPEILGKVAAQNRTKSIDRILRRGACGYGSSYPTHTIHVDGSAAMTSLTSTDVVTWDFLEELGARAYSLGIEPLKSGGFVSIVHPLLFNAIRGLTEVKSVGYYQKPEIIFAGAPASGQMEVAGITFIRSRLGRIYPSSGTTLQAATTVTTAVNKGGTSVVVGDATGLAVGNWIALGTIETESVSPGTNLEKVQITGVNSSTLTIRGNGRGDDFGFRFDHAAGESVLEAYDIAAIPIIGRNSLIGVHGAESGQYGIPKMQLPVDTLGRVTKWGWYWYGGVGVINKNLILGKVALTNSVLGYN